MKQTKKLTRVQREYLQKRKKDTEGVRVVEDTKDYIIYFDKDGNRHTLYKED